MTKYHLLAFTNPVAGREAEFNQWYTEQHLPDLLAVPGFVSAQRFKLKSNTEQPLRFSYLALYEIDSDDINGVLAEMNSRVGTEAMPMTDAADHTSFDSLIAIPVSERVVPKSK